MQPETAVFKLILMTAKEIRQQFLTFFESKGHKIVPSAPIVVKDDPTLMFTNAGMNQFKDYFLGNQTPDVRRIADTQKCLRVSGKHNDLEEVGRDSYHHTMFEMLGNWSFGDYFKKEAIQWAWELLTEVYGLDKDRLYVSVFEGDESEGLERDNEAVGFWKAFVPEDRILYFDKKDNFWEMGDTGPCGPCSEIHVDLRSDEDREKISGATLVNADDPLVVEIWNLVFIQFNRKSDGSLEELPEKHVDTGMGFERLVMAMQSKKANYDTDLFMPLIRKVEEVSGKTYQYSYAADANVDIAMRVVVDHIRAVSFAVADGQLPGNTGAGYVIRRILRRAVRYYYSFLEIHEPFLYKLVPLLSEHFGEVFPELRAQVDQVANIVQGEEKAFLHTLENGLKRFESLEAKNGVISGDDAFELYDTYGFPIDLTHLIASENGLQVDQAGFEKALQQQKDRSRAAARREVGDWTVIRDGDEVQFIGYDHLSVEDARVIKYRTVKAKKGDQYQLVLDKTPFYPEGGGQVGDTGLLWFGEEKIPVIDTKKENDLIIHFVKKLPAQPDLPVRGEVNTRKRHLTENNHTGTHLLHAALRQVLGDHVQQKGSLLNDNYLRFDFSHFQKVTEEEIAEIETIVNRKIRENIPLQESRSIPIEEAKASGAMMLFGEKYGDSVRMITFDPGYSRELCGGTHVPATGKIGLLKIYNETAVAAGIRRIEAYTADKAEAYINKELDELNRIREIFKNPLHPAKNVAGLQEENKQLQKQVEQLLAAQAASLKSDLLKQVEDLGDCSLLVAKVGISDSNTLKNLAYQLEKEVDNAVIVFGAVINNKPQLMVTISKALAESTDLHAGNMVRELAKNIKGGGGGQAFFATAGGKDAGGLDAALDAARGLVTAAT
jgi:alanyl-tRNA synthetase